MLLLEGENIIPYPTKIVIWKYSQKNIVRKLSVEIDYIKDRPNIFTIYILFNTLICVNCSGLNTFSYTYLICRKEL